MDLLASLNPQQKKAVTAVKGPVLVLAGPGSGKTRVLTHRVAYMVRECHIPSRRIMAVTFTNKAARAMKERLEDGLLTPSELQGLTIGTFHSICARILRRDIERLTGYDRNFVIYDSGDQLALVRQALKALDLDEKQWIPQALHSAISKAKNELVSPGSFRTATYWEEVAKRVYERYQELLKANNALDFDDLLMKTYELLNRHPDVRESYQERYLQVLVDEFQDTNIAQYELVKMLAGKYRNLFCVGDEDQSIYSWRGADFRNVLRFRDDFADSQLILLEQNYRSTETIITAAQNIIRRNRQRHDKSLFTQRGKGTPINLIETYNETDEAEFVTSEIARLERAGIPSGHCAVMYRTNAQSRVLEEAFVKKGMPYRLVRGTRFYERKEIKDALCYLRLLHNPDDGVSLSRVINIPPRGIGDRSLDELFSAAEGLSISPWKALLRLRDGEDNLASRFASRSRKALSDFTAMFADLLQAKEQMSLLELIDQMLAQSGYRDFVRDRSDEGEERWENLQELRSVAQEYNNLAGAEALALFLEEIALVSDVDSFKDDASGAALLTLHMAKGLEFPIVFLVGMEEGVFPHLRSMEDENEMEEERRLCYVGITRAKDQLYMLYAFRRRLYGREELAIPSRFLKDIPRELLQQKNGHQETTAVKIHGVASAPGAGQWPRTPSPTAKVQGKFKTGDVVRHSVFGEGVVVESKLSGGDEEVSIAFAGKGIKRLLVSFAPLQKIR
jgi:DNA helicase II / ATP-dependent DNA helicase PcrA